MGDNDFMTYVTPCHITHSTSSHALSHHFWRQKCHSTRRDVTGRNATQRLKKQQETSGGVTWSPQNNTGMGLGKIPGVKCAKWGSWVTSVFVKVGSELLSVERQWVVTLFMVVLTVVSLKVSSSRRNLLERWALCLKCDKARTVSDLKGCVSLIVLEL